MPSFFLTVQAKKSSLDLLHQKRPARAWIETTDRAAKKTAHLLHLYSIKLAVSSGCAVACTRYPGYVKIKLLFNSLVPPVSGVDGFEFFLGNILRKRAFFNFQTIFSTDLPGRMSNFLRLQQILYGKLFILLFNLCISFRFSNIHSAGFLFGGLRVGDFFQFRTGFLLFLFHLVFHLVRHGLFR